VILAWAEEMQIAASDHRAVLAVLEI